MELFADSQIEFSGVSLTGSRGWQLRIVFAIYLNPLVNQITESFIHGKNEKKVYERLCDLVDEWIEIYGKDNAPLPPATAGKRYSGKFNLRVGEELHERLAIESLKVSESLNSYCVKVLKDQVGS